MLKKSLVIMGFLCLGACASKPAVQPVTYQTFMVWYNGAVGKRPLMQYVHQQKAKVLYEYPNYNGVVLQMPVHGTVQETQAALEKVWGVLSVQQNRVM